MFKLAIVAAAAKNSRYKGSSDDGLAIFFGIPIIIIILAIFVASPIICIVGGAKAIGAESADLAVEALELASGGVFGLFISFIVSFTIVPSTVMEYFRPWPPRRNSWYGPSKEEMDRYEDELKKFRWRAQLPIVLITLAIIAGVIVASIQAFRCWDGTPKTTGTIFIVLASFALAMNIASVIVKITLE